MPQANSDKKNPMINIEQNTYCYLVLTNVGYTDKKGPTPRPSVTD